jgi:hypothetical protein
MYLKKQICFEASQMVGKDAIMYADERIATQR